MSKHVLVTGGCGFIGKNVCFELLRRGYAVDVIDLKFDSDLKSKGVKIICSDVREIENNIDNSVDYKFILHLSGILGTSELFGDPVFAVENNVIGALKVIQYALKKQNIKVFFPSKPNSWNNIYSVTSQAVEKIGLTYKVHYGLDVRVLRLWNVYGPFQNNLSVRKIIPTWIRSAFQDGVIEIYGDGEQLINNIYVYDVSKYIVDLMELTECSAQVMKIGGFFQTTVNELAGMIKKEISQNLIIKYLPMRVGEEGAYLFDGDVDIEDVVGVRYVTDFVEGLKNTIYWYQANVL